VADLIGCLCSDEESVQQVCGALLTLREERLLSKVSSPVEQPTRLSPEQVRHYDRQIRFFQDLADSDLVGCDEGITAQERLSSASVLICGLGGLGNVVASSLAAAGVGTLVLCDDDVVEASNLTRQVMFSTDDIGRGKADALAARLTRINPYVSLVPEKRRVERAADISGLAKASDLVISCADQPSVAEMSAIMTEACWPDTPHVLGGSYSFHLGLFGLFVIPGVTACWHCLRAAVSHEHGRERSRPFIPKTRNAGVIGAQSGVIGNVIAWEAVRFLAGMETGLSNRWVEFDFGPLALRERPIVRRPDCPWCSRTVNRAGGARPAGPEGQE
jgi:bacteriocin biosynthesis cyclodehydratase domain-containing protein